MDTTQMTTDSAAPVAASTDTSTTKPAAATTQNADSNTSTTDAAATTQEDSATEQQTAVEYANPEVPEGLTLDEGFLTDFTNIAKESGLSPEQFKKMTDMGAKMATSIMTKAQEANQQRIDGWRQETENDKEIGGEKLAENLSIAKRAMETFGSPELSAVLEESGLGNHPAVIKALVKIGRGVSEDSLVPGGAQSSASNKTIAQQMYPNMNP